MAASNLKTELIAQAEKAGFDVVRVLGAESVPPYQNYFADFIENKLYGDMVWMAETAPRRTSPKALWPQARSVIVMGMNYGPKIDPLSQLAHKSHGAISVYAQGGDYHQLIKRRLKRVASWLAQTSGELVKIFVDTAPVMEKPLAQMAGLGWQGKHSNLVSKRFGSWLFLGEIFTTARLAPDPEEADHCGSCRRCLEICPTKAFPAPYQLDPRRCISYLTIEHKGHIPYELRKAIGNRIFGCDDCLAVCPWNKFAQLAREARFQPRPTAALPKLADLLALDEAAFRERFKGSPVKRAGRDRFIRNVLIAAGNSQNKQLLGPIERLLSDPSPLVRAMAVWAYKELAGAKALHKAFLRYGQNEPDKAVQTEWQKGLGKFAG